MLDLLIPMLLAAVAVAALARRQDLYAALLEGGLDGLRLLVSIVPALVMLLTAVHLLRASGAVDLLTRWLTPAARVLGLPPQVLPLVLLRPDGRRCARQHGDDVLHHFRLFRRGRDPPHALCRARGAYRRPDGVSRRCADGALFIDRRASGWRGGSPRSRDP